MNKTEVLQSISKTYTPLSTACQQAVATQAILQSYDKHDTLVREGQYSDQVFYIVQGCARAYYLKDGRDVTDWFAFEEAFISPIVSFFSDKPSFHSIEVLEDTVVLELSRAKLDPLAAIYPDLERLIREVVTKTMLSQQEKNATIQFFSAEQKYENLLKLRPDIVQRVPLSTIASYLGITLETLSRVRHSKRRI